MVHAGSYALLLILSEQCNDFSRLEGVYSFVKKECSSLSNVVLLPDPNLLSLVSIEVDETMTMITVFAVTTSPEAKCPLCQQTSSKVQSHYTRTLADLSCFGQTVRWFVQVRRIFCLNTSCKRKIFTERLPTFAPAYARRMLRQADALGEIAFALGGKAGEQIARLLAMAVSHDTLLRLIRRSADPPAPTPRILGVDDFAWRRGQRYGTILVDLERHEVIDILPERDGKSLLAWLREHPGVEIVSRDRASAYADAAREGAPDAIQVADRFHLLMNMREAIQRLLTRKKSCLPEIENEEQVSSTSLITKQTSDVSSVEAGMPEKTQQLQEGELQEMKGSVVTFARDSTREKHYHTSVQASKQAHRTGQTARFEAVWELHRQGISIRAISRTLGISRPTISRYLAVEQLPEPSAHPHGQVRSASILDPFVAYMLKRWSEGCFNGTQLYREICLQGYTGSRSLVSLLVADMRKTLPPPLEISHQIDRVVNSYERPVTGKHHIKQIPGRRRLSPKQASWLMVSSVEKLTERQQAALTLMCEAGPELKTAYELAQQFVHMVTERKAAHLSDWLERTSSSDLAELKSMAQGIRRDFAAVTEALSSSVSNGQVEGQVHRLKLLKRQGYGRANMDLLRRRVLHASRQRNQQKCV